MLFRSVGYSTDEKSLIWYIRTKEHQWEKTIRKNAKGSKLRLYINSKSQRIHVPYEVQTHIKKIKLNTKEKCIKLAKDYMQNVNCVLEYGWGHFYQHNVNYEPLIMSYGLPGKNIVIPTIGGSKIDLPLELISE